MACALARCPGRCASRVLRAWLPRSLACSVCCALVPGLPCLLAPWLLCCVGGLCAWRPGLLACPVLVGCVRPVYGPALWAVWLGLIFRPFIVVSLEGLLKKALIFALYFSGIFSLDFSPLCAGLYFFWFIFPASRSRIFFSGFFCVEISGEFFRIYFFGFFLALFSRRYLASSFFSM